MHIAIVGATGVVGQTFLAALDDFNLPYTELTLVASERSVGTIIEHRGTDYTVRSMEDAVAASPDIALFSAGGATSKEWAPRFAERGTYVIDNSSAWRMDPSCPLVVPEVNADRLRADQRIIANPNCSTIQLVVILDVLERLYGLERVIVSTYQSVSGTGKAAIDQLQNERKGNRTKGVYNYPIYDNCIPHCDVFLDNDYTREEMKLVHESRKILDLPELRLSATAVRVPVSVSHSEAVNAELKNRPDIDHLRAELSKTQGVKVLDKPSQEEYPMPLFAVGSNEVYVGRIRRDLSHPQALNMWIVSDNLRKGAATNALQIAEIVAAQFVSQPKISLGSI